MTPDRSRGRSTPSRPEKAAPGGVGAATVEPESDDLRRSSLDHGELSGSPERDGGLLHDDIDVVSECPAVAEDLVMDRPQTGLAPSVLGVQQRVWGRGIPIPMGAHGVREVELSWILEDNSGMRSIIEAIGGEAYKRYRIYEKAI